MLKLLQIILLLLNLYFTSFFCSQYSTIQRALISQTKATYHTSINQTKIIFALQLKRIKNELFFAMSNTRLALEGILIEITKSLREKSKLISLYEHLWLLDVRLKRFTSLTTATKKAINKLSPNRNIHINQIINDNQIESKKNINMKKPPTMPNAKPNSINHTSEELADLLQIYYNEQLRANKLQVHDNDYTLT
ncbi:hypothetical protein SNEBB_002612 [Seison nebaliae]|nr:hypothetical protein SNEBB_002612 [Seison nebaliae]